MGAKVMSDELRDLPGFNRLDGADDRVVELATREPVSIALDWQHDPGDPNIQTPLTFARGGEYIISHRCELALDDEYIKSGVVRHREFFVLSWRPPGQHHALGHCRTLDGAKATAAKHHAGARCTCASIWSREHEPACPLAEIVAAMLTA
jgi:hypothetical protein